MNDNKFPLVAVIASRLEDEQALDTYEEESSVVLEYPPCASSYNSKVQECVASFEILRSECFSSFGTPRTFPNETRTGVAVPNGRIRPSPSILAPSRSAP